MADQRDAITWVAIELSHQGENKVLDGTLEETLRRDLGVDEDHPIFIPCTTYERSGQKTTFHLMEGYVFVASGLDEILYFRLERQPYVNKVMSTKAGKHRLRALSVITSTHIKEMQNKLQEMVSSEIPVGETVMVLEGTYKHLSGTIMGIENENAHVHISLRSLEVVATIPRIFLEASDG